MAPLRDRFKRGALQKSNATIRAVGLTYAFPAFME